MLGQLFTLLPIMVVKLTFASLKLSNMKNLSVLTFLIYWPLKPHGTSSKTFPGNSFKKGDNSGHLFKNFSSIIIWLIKTKFTHHLNNDLSICFSSWQRLYSSIDLLYSSFGIGKCSTLFKESCSRQNHISHLRCFTHKDFLNN